MFRRKQNDLEILKTLAGYRILTQSQLTVLHFSGKQVASRRLAQMVDQGFVETIQRAKGRGRGRPENLFGITSAGAQLLRDAAILRHSVPDDRVTGEKLLPMKDHQLLVNWFKIHLTQIAYVIPHHTVHFLAPTSPFLAETSHLCITDEVPVSVTDSKTVKFTPDGAFVISDGKQNKAVLFFLEVDMGTETLASPQGDGKDIRQKVINYQACFRSATYKRFERVWNIHLNGFRLLFLAHDPIRMREICQLVQSMKPSEFIWVSDQDRMFKEGLAGAIWSRGGRYETPPQSILSSQMCRPSPVLPIKP